MEGCPASIKNRSLEHWGRPCPLNSQGLGDIGGFTPAEILEHKPHGGGTYTWLTREDINSQSLASVGQPYPVTGTGVVKTIG